MNKIALTGHNNPPSELEIIKQRLADEEWVIRDILDGIISVPLPEVIENEIVSGQVTERIKNLRNVIGGVEKIHKQVKAPFLECGKAVDAWKNKLEFEIEILRKAAEKPQQAWLTKKANEERARQLEIAKLQREEAEKLAAEALAHQDANIQDVADELWDGVVKSEAIASRIEQNIAFARPSDLAKSRSATGAVASQKMAWVGKITSLRGIDLEILRPYFSEDVIQKALNAFVKNGGRECAGASITEEIIGLNVR